MKRGKYICSQLKAIRRSIAEENNIPLEIPECTYEGECRGTCPRCESEVKYLEAELSRRARMGVAATVAGIAVTLTSCDGEHHPLQPQDDVSYEDTLLHIDTTTTDSAAMPRCLANKLDSPILPTEVAIVGDCEILPLPDEDKYIKTGIIGDEDIVEGESDIMLLPEEEPEFPGGMDSLVQYFSNNLRYPEEAQKAGIEGKVYVRFVVEKDGSISNINILREIGGGCGKEAVRVVRAMPKWKPGRNKGEAVRSQFNLPIRFQIPKD